MFITKYFKKVDSVKPSQPPLVPPLQKIEHVASHSLKPIQNENISSLESEVSLIVPETADCTPISSYPSPEQAKHNSPHTAVSKVTIRDTITVLESSSDTNYEEVRLENIRRNEQFLMTLGLGGGSSLVTTTGTGKNSTSSKSNTNASRSKSKRSATAIVDKVEMLPRRIQPRRAASAASGGSSSSSGSGGTMASTINCAESAGDAVDEDAIGIIAAEEVPHVEIEYDSSAVLQYVLSCKKGGDHVNTGVSDVHSSNPTHLPTDTDTVACDTTGSAGLTLCIRGSSSAADNDGDGELWCDDLAAVYSLHTHPTHPHLVAAAGKGGQIAVFSSDRHTTSSSSSSSGNGSIIDIDSVNRGSDSDSHTDPLLLSFRGHDRWVSSVRFVDRLSTAATPAITLASAADDGRVMIWDLALAGAGIEIGQSESKPKTKAKQPKQLCWSHCGHGGKGIFAMDVLGDSILTGSKDRSVSYSILDGSGEAISMVSSYNLHSGVVKSVSWKGISFMAGSPSHIFASGSQDGSVAVKDTRTNSEDPELYIDSAHSGGVHSVQWCPYAPSDYYLLTAGYDNIVRVFDTRMLSTNNDGDHMPQCVFHCSEHVLTGSGSGMSKGAVKRSKDIFTPCFLSASTVLVPSLKASSLSVYNIVSGSVISRGLLNHPPIAVYCSRNRSVRHTGISGICVSNDSSMRSSFNVPTCIVAATKSNGTMLVMDIMHQVQ